MIAYKNLFNQLFCEISTEQREKSWDQCRMYLEDYHSEGTTEDIFFSALLDTDFGQEDILMKIDHKDVLSEDSNELVEQVNYIGDIYKLPYEYVQGFKPDCINETAMLLADWLQPLGYKLVRWDVDDADFCGFIIDEHYLPNLLSLVKQANVECVVQELSEEDFIYDYQRPALYQDSAYFSRHDAESLILAHKEFFYFAASSSSLEQKKKDSVWSIIKEELEYGFFELGEGYSAYTFECAIESATFPDYNNKSLMRNNRFYLDISDSNVWIYLVHEVEYVSDFYIFNEHFDEETRFFPDDNIKELSGWLSKQGYQLIRWHQTHFGEPENEKFRAFIVKKDESQKLLSLGKKARIWLEQY